MRHDTNDLRHSRLESGILGGPKGQANLDKCKTDRANAQVSREAAQADLQNLEAAEMSVRDHERGTWHNTIRRIHNSVDKAIDSVLKKHQITSKELFQIERKRLSDRLLDDDGEFTDYLKRKCKRVRGTEF